MDPCERDQLIAVSQMGESDFLDTMSSKHSENRFVIVDQTGSHVKLQAPDKRR